MGLVCLAGMIQDLKKRDGGWLSEAEEELLSWVDDAGAVHLHNKGRDVAKPEPAHIPSYSPSGFLEGCEPDPDKVPDLVKHHEAEIEKLEALLKASK